jgi:hypothetical protein
MTRSKYAVWIALAALAVLAGCGKKAEQAATTASDSLLAASPVEPAQGNITPQSDYQQQPAGETAKPAPAETPKKKMTVKPSTPPASTAPAKTGVTIPAGTGIKVAVNAKISSETAQQGEAWEGTVKAPIIIGDRVAIPEGAIVHGVVSGVLPAEKGSRAVLVLAVRSVDIDGVSYSVGATADSIIAGSTRARNVGAVAGGAAAGALIGKAVGGGGKGALIGGLIGGAATAGAVAGTKGYQVIVQEGSEMTFTTREAEVVKNK